MSGTNSATSLSKEGKRRADGEEKHPREATDLPDLTKRMQRRAAPALESVIDCLHYKVIVNCLFLMLWCSEVAATKLPASTSVGFGICVNHPLICCLHSQFEEPHNSLLMAMQCFDFLGDGLISKTDLKEVLSGFGFKITASELHFFLTRLVCKDKKDTSSYTFFSFI